MMPVLAVTTANSAAPAPTCARVMVSAAWANRFRVAAAPVMLVPVKLSAPAPASASRLIVPVTVAEAAAL